MILNTYTPFHEKIISPLTNLCQKLKMNKTAFQALEKFGLE